MKKWLGAAAALAIGFLAAFTPNVNSGITVANNTELKGLAGGNYTAAFRAGYSAAGDGGAITYVWGAAACTLNAGAGDDGSQVKPNNNTSCWKAQFTNGIDPRVFGADQTGVADSTDAANRAFASTAGNGGLVRFQPGTYRFSGVLTASVTTAYSSMNVDGKGAKLVWDAAPGGIAITLNGPTSVNTNCYTNYVKLTDLDLRTDVPNGGSAVKVTALAACGNASGAPVSTINVTTHGNGETSYWTRGVEVVKLSNINFEGDHRGRAALGMGLGPAGIGVDLLGTLTEHGVGYNFRGMNFEGLQKGIFMGDYTEGVTVTGGTNFTSISPGCGIEVNGDATLQLLVSNSQFGISSGHVCVDSNFVGLNVSNNFMISFGGNRIIDIGPHVVTGINVSNNHFLSGDVAPSNALLLRNTSGTAIFCGNYLQWVGTGIRVESATAGFDVRCDSNHMDFLTMPKLVENVAASTNVWFPDVVDVTNFGGTCFGPFGTDIGPALALADATVGVNKIGISKSCRLTTNRTIAHPLYIGKNGVMTLDGGVVLTPNGGVEVNTFLPFAGAGTTSYGAQIAFGTGVTGTQLFYGPDLRFPDLPTVAGAPGTIWNDGGTLKVSP